MFNQHPENVAATLPDISTYFSDEEWKPLHKWQKELYRNVMKEIHQALMSLGPLIATTVLSLRTYEKDDLCPMDNLDSERRHPVNNCATAVSTGSRVLPRINGEGNQFLKNSRDTDRRERNKYPNSVKGHHIVNPDTPVKTSHSKESYMWDPQEPERTDMEISTSDYYPAIYPNIIHPNQSEEELHCKEWCGSEITKHPTEGSQILNADFSWRKAAESTAFMRDDPAEEGQSSTNPEQVISLIIKKEEEACSLEHWEVENKRRNASPVAGESTNRQKKFGDSLKYLKPKTSCKTSSQKTNKELTQISHKGTQAKKQLWPESNSEPQGERTTQCENDSRNSQLFIPHREGTNVGISQKYNEFEYSRSNSDFPIGPPITMQNLTSYTCNESGKCYSLKEELTKHMAEHLRVRPYICTDCGKSFLQKGNLIKHYRTHTGEKPFACTFCRKSFSRKDYLNGHMRTHTGERPYKCTVCEKSFIQKGEFNQHRRKHI